MRSNCPPTKCPPPTRCGCGIALPSRMVWRSGWRRCLVVTHGSGRTSVSPSRSGTLRHSSTWTRALHWTPSMRDVVVITGGAGGMGLAAAKIVGRDHAVVICDVSQDRLNAAAAQLTDAHIECTAVVCDITDKKSVAELVATAST